MPVTNWKKPTRRPPRFQESNRVEISNRHERRTCKRKGLCFHFVNSPQRSFLHDLFQSANRIVVIHRRNRSAQLQTASSNLRLCSSLQEESVALTSVQMLTPVSLSGHCDRLAVVKGLQSVVPLALPFWRFACIHSRVAGRDWKIDQEARNRNGK